MTVVRQSIHQHYFVTSLDLRRKGWRGWAVWHEGWAVWRQLDLSLVCRVCFTQFSLKKLIGGRKGFVEEALY